MQFKQTFKNIQKNTKIYLKKDIINMYFKTEMYMKVNGKIINNTEKEIADT